MTKQHYPEKTDAIAPTTTLILFSSADYAKNYGIVFTAYGAGALGGTLLAGRIRNIFGSYTVFFYPKKEQLKERGRKYARMLSGWAYGLNRFLEAV